MGSEPAWPSWFQPLLTWCANRNEFTLDAAFLDWLAGNRLGVCYPKQDYTGRPALGALDGVTFFEVSERPEWVWQVSPFAR